jgi:undecaprenyl pyrophosphate phosphatase UppP
VVHRHAPLRSEAEALPAGLPIEKAAKTLAVVAGGDLVLIVIATVPAGTLGLAFEHGFRVLFAKRLAAMATSVFAVIFLSRCFKTRTLSPFAVYSVLFGAASAVRFGVF